MPESPDRTSRNDPLRLTFQQRKGPGITPAQVHRASWFTPIGLIKGKSRFGLIVLMSWLIVGCHATEPQVTTDVLAGTYVYFSQDPESRTTDRNLNHLVLRSNREYALVEGGSTKATTAESGIWTIEPGNPSNVLLKNEVLPIEIKQDGVRLLVDLDRGIWWAKAK
jgi:hypothetical protein